jgi:hypothetical protein
VLEAVITAISVAVHGANASHLSTLALRTKRLFTPAQILLLFEYDEEFEAAAQSARRQIRMSA